MDKSLQSFDVATGDHRGQVDTSRQVKRAALISGLIGFLVGGVFVCSLTRNAPRDHLYRTLTGNFGHILPEMYGRVKEKTIWLYWSKRKKIPDFVQLCIESIQQNRGSFDVRLLYRDDVRKYVSLAELPFQWEKFQPVQQKDSLMNALLARYGGVALDITTVLLESFDNAWDNMISKGAVFHGYMYGKKETAVWCMMARRETLFRSATIAQVIGVGDATHTRSYRDRLDSAKSQYFAFGDRTITPIIHMYDYSRGTCFTPMIGPKDACYPPHSSVETVGEELGREKLIINDADNYTLRFCAENYTCGLYRVSERPSEWAEFEDRRHQGFMPFVKLFQSGGSAKTMSRSQFLAQRDSFLLTWLCLAKVPNIGCTVT